MAETMEKKLRLGDLYDHYGKLLTQKQQEILDQYCMDDLSLAEISENLAISRQAVFDTVRKAEKQFEELEGNLNLLARHQKRKKLLDEALALTDRLTENHPSEQSNLMRLRDLITEVLE